MERLGNDDLSPILDHPAPRQKQQFFPVRMEGRISRFGGAFGGRTTGSPRRIRSRHPGRRWFRSEPVPIGENRCSRFTAPVRFPDGQVQRKKGLKPDIGRGKNAGPAAPLFRRWQAPRLFPRGPPQARCFPR